MPDMPYTLDDLAAHERRRWTKANAHLYVRHDAHRFRRPDAPGWSHPDEKLWNPYFRHRERQTDRAPAASVLSGAQAARNTQGVRAAVRESPHCVSC